MRFEEIRALGLPGTGEGRCQYGIMLAKLYTHARMQADMHGCVWLNVVWNLVCDFMCFGHICASRESRVSAVCGCVRIGVGVCDYIYK